MAKVKESVLLDRAKALFACGYPTATVCSRLVDEFGVTVDRSEGVSTKALEGLSLRSGEVTVDRIGFGLARVQESLDTLLDRAVSRGADAAALQVLRVKIMAAKTQLDQIKVAATTQILHEAQHMTPAERMAALAGLWGE